MRADSGVWGAHGCTVLVSAFCGNELPATCSLFAV